MIIYPPLIANTIPAFASNKVIIPFTQNPAVGKEEYTAFKLRYKEYSDDGDYQILRMTINNSGYSYDPNTKNGELTFDFKDNKPKAGYYKFQLAYMDGDDEKGWETSPFSVVSIGRCIGTKLPTLELKGLSTSSLNLNPVLYIGEYSTAAISEALYSYQIIVKDEKNKLLQDTGVVIHDIDTDTIENVDGVKTRISQFQFKLKYELKTEAIYKISCSIRTVNGYEMKRTYSVIAAAQLAPSYRGSLKVEQDAEAIENGYIKISIQKPTGKSYAGKFLLERTSDLLEWNQLVEFELKSNSKVEEFIWKDRTVEHGVEYIYALRETYTNTNNITYYSDRIKSDPVVAKFDDLFLGDADRQLKVKFNPQVSSIKTTLLESKTDTIGGKYPFFFRNNQVRYKEIPISGLISYHMDENEMFMKQDFEPSINLTHENFYNERKFKEEVLEWLTNGKPKLFRSPAEGNCVVRLLNTSLSPNTQVGRMLHTFSTTGYEMMDKDLDTLIKNDLINYSTYSNKIERVIGRQLDKKWYDSTSGENKGVFKRSGITTVRWTTRYPDKTTIWLDDKMFKNVSGYFESPAGKVFSKIKITEGAAQYDTIKINYNEAESTNVDSFKNSVDGKYNILFQAPKTKGISNVLNGSNGTVTIYHTYAIRAKNAGEETQYFKIGGNIQAISKGEEFVWYNLPASTKYLKVRNSKGEYHTAETYKNDTLVVDIYARTSGLPESNYLISEG